LPGINILEKCLYREVISNVVIILQNSIGAMTVDMFSTK